MERLFTTLFGFVGIGTCAILANAMLLKARTTEARYVRIAEKGIFWFILFMDGGFYFWDRTSSGVLGIIYYEISSYLIIDLVVNKSITLFFA